MYILKNYEVFKSQITKSQITSQWVIRMQETYLESLDKTESSKKIQQHDTIGENLGNGGGICYLNTEHRVTKLAHIICFVQKNNEN